MAKREKPLEPFVEVRTSRCHAGSDGECFWSECPQLRDYKAICPLVKQPCKAWRTPHD